MSEFSQLSKEEQEAILRMRKKAAKPKESKTPQDSPVEICKYVAGKGGKEKCTDHSSTPYGFCKKHSRTVQAKKAREEYESAECTTATCSTTPSTVSSSKITEKNDSVTKEPPKKNSKQPIPIKEEPPKKNSKQPVKEEPPKKTTKQSAPVKEEPLKKNSKSPVKEPQALHKEVVRSKKIHPNHWDRFEDPVTHIVFDKNTKEAYGVQEPSGKVSALKQEHIQICIRNKWNYNLPYASDDEESESIHDSDFDEDEELSESEEDSSSDDDEEGEDVDGLVDSESSLDPDEEELVDSDEESDDSDDDDSDDDDSDDDDSDDDDSDDSR